MTGDDESREGDRPFELILFHATRSDGLGLADAQPTRMSKMAKPHHASM